MRKSRGEIIKDIAIIVLILTFVSLFLGNFQIAWVEGTSMAPTLNERQILLIQKTYTNVSTSDIIVFQLGNNLCIKRVIAIEGDLVELRNHCVYINEAIIRGVSYEGRDCNYPLEEGEYFVLGDNYLNSLDSRVYGPIKSNQIIGVVLGA